MKKTLSLLMATVIFLSFSVTSVRAETSKNEDIPALCEKIYSTASAKSNAGTEEEFTEFCARNITSSYGQYVFPLAATGADVSAFADEICSAISSSRSSPASTRQKYALMLLACGCENEYCDTVVDETAGSQGIMSLVFALHLLNNGRTSEKYTSDSLAAEIVDLSLENGGWALRGETADADVTAMTLQALAPFYKIDEKITACIEKSLTLLAEKQNDDGSFSGFGGKNAESTAQVTIALSALGIKPETLSKNGNTVLDGLKLFISDDGVCSHTENGEYDANAQMQCYTALVAVQHGNVYLFNGKESLLYKEIETKKDETATNEEKNGLPLNVLAAVVICCAGAAVCIILFVLKKRSAKNFIFTAVVTLIAAVVAFSLNISTPDEYYNGVGSDVQNPVGSVTVSVRCDSAAGENGLPEDGIMLEKTEFQIGKDDTVYDVLCSASRKYSLKLISDGAGAGMYVRSIGGLSEFDFGELSGWVFTVNGETQSVSCSACKLKDGDAVEWFYSKELGNDVKVTVG